VRVFEKRMLRRIFGPKRDDVTGEWRKLHNEELYDLYTSHNILFSFFLSSCPLYFVFIIFFQFTSYFTYPTSFFFKIAYLHFLTPLFQWPSIPKLSVY